MAQLSYLDPRMQGQGHRLLTRPGKNSLGPEPVLEGVGMRLLPKALLPFLMLAGAFLPAQAQASVDPLDSNSECPQKDIESRRDERNNCLCFAGANVVGAAIGAARRNPWQAGVCLSAAGTLATAAWQAHKEVAAMEDHNTQVKARPRVRPDRERPDRWLARSAKRPANRSAHDHNSLSRNQQRKGLVEP